MVGRHSNWLDQWRLFFATLVIVSHSFDLLGREAAEPLRFTTGYMTLGGLAVAGFFAISGYLITRSWTKHPLALPYLRNRFLRIVPAFFVAVALSVLIVGPITTGFGLIPYLSHLNWARLAYDLLTLDQPHAPSIEPYPAVNSSVGTLRYEFLCYLLAPLAVASRAAMVSLWTLSLWLAVWTASYTLPWFAVFLSGAIYYRFELMPGKWTLWASAIALPILIPTPLWAVGLAIPGCLLLLTVGLRPKRGFDLPDISYGTYLYGWPIQKLLIFAGVANPLVLMWLAVSLSLLAGVASWFGIEKWALSLKQRRQLAPKYECAAASQVAGGVQEP